MEKIVGTKIAREILNQNAENAISSIAVDSKTDKVLVRGKLCPYKEKSSSANKQSVTDFAEKIKSLPPVGKEGDDVVVEEKAKGVLTVESRSGKELEIRPLKLDGSRLKYQFKGKEHLIELDKLTVESAEKIKEYLE